MAAIDAEEDFRKELAKICGQAVRIFAEPCKKCDIDQVPGTDQYVADPEKDFRFGLIARVTTEGTLDPDDVYVVPLTDLTTRSQRTKMAFGYGPERVSVS